MTSERRFLIINTYGIGDVLFTVPMLKNIKQNIPGAFIGYVANLRTAALLQNCPEVDTIIIYDRDEFQSVYKKSWVEYLKLLSKTITKIREQKYDIVFDLSMTGYAAYYCLLAGIKKRAGLNFKNRGIFLTEKYHFKGFENRPVAEYYLDLLRSRGFEVKPATLDIPVPGVFLSWAEDYLAGCDLRPGRFVAVFPGGGESWGSQARFKRWPAVKYAELVERICREFHCGVLLMGNKSEENLCKEIQSLVKWPLNNVCGAVNISQCLALLKKSRLAVVNDGGPLHMAVSAGAPTVSVFGPVDEKVYGPYPPGEKHRVVTADISCRPCYRQFRRAACEHLSCIKNIEVDDVFKLVKNLLTFHDSRTTFHV